MTPISHYSVRPSLHMRALLGAVAITALAVLPGTAFAQTATDTITTSCGFFSSVSSVLNALSIVVVTIAIIFTGYKVAFAHARIGEVAPVLIGAILIGAASQIAKMFLSNSAGGNACAVIVHVVKHYA